MLVPGVEIVRLGREANYEASDIYKIQQLALAATIARIKSEKFQLPDNI